MQNKNLVIAGVSIMLCQLFVGAMLAIGISWVYFSEIDVSYNTAALAIGGTFFITLNILALILIGIGASKGN